MSKKVKLIVFIFGLIALASVANFVLAADFGVNQVNNVIKLSTGDPRVIIGRIIQIALSFLGIIAITLIMYAGFLWMTSGGSEEKIASAKQILKNAVIGLAIILGSWAITTFVLAQLLAAINGNLGGPTGPGGGSLVDPGIGAMGNCTIESVYPENGQTDVARNSSIIITFKEAAKIASGICVDASGASCACDSSPTSTCNMINPSAIRVYKSDLGDACASGCPAPNSNANITDIKIAVSSDNKTLILSPLSYLGNPNTNAWYTVKITSDVKKLSDGLSMFQTCDLDYFNWNFEIGTRLDLTPPQVVYGKIFPRPDNLKDIQNQTQDPIAAHGSLTINNCPRVYKASTIVIVDPIGASPVATASPLNYGGSITKFRVDISPISPDRAQLSEASNPTNLLGTANFDNQGNATFIGYFSLKAIGRQVGNAWDVTLTPEQLADNLVIGGESYIFVPAGPQAQTNHSIGVPLTCDTATVAAGIQAIISDHPQLKSPATLNGSTVEMVAKVKGAGGNDILMTTSNPAAIDFVAFNGGVDRIDLAETKDKKDTPMNTVVQINFSEAVNPLKVAGLASEVANYIKIVNYATSSFVGNTPCTENSQCLSYKCEGPVGNKVCVGDYIGGKFLLSNAYRTLEFISDNECGVNGCGEKIYCLPANSHLAVQMRAADLKACTSNNDCLAFSPFQTCSSTPLGYSTCQDLGNKNYPTASGALNGIIDMSLNSFDGNRNIFSDGPIAIYSDNYEATDAQNLNKRDNYNWSFYVNDKIMLEPPKIESVSPLQGTLGVTLADPLKISWNTLMMNSSLTTGSRMINNGSSTIEHKLVNLKSSSPSALGYWVTNDNIDTPPLDNEPDKTVSWIKHTPLAESMSYRAQAGSGIRDIYQNCFKPSAGASCAASDIMPSCCFGLATSTLGADGNCQ